MSFKGSDKGMKILRIGILGKTKQKPQGQAVVELAIAMPVLMLFLLGMIDLGRYLYTYDRMVAAAREGVRVASESTYFQKTIFPITSPHADYPLQQDLIASATSRAQLVLTNAGIPWWTSGLTVTATINPVLGFTSNMEFITSCSNNSFMLGCIAMNMTITCPVDSLVGNVAAFLGVNFPDTLMVRARGFIGG